MVKINLHIYPSVFKFESRMLKEADTVIRLKLAETVIILSAGEKTQATDEAIADSISVHRIKPIMPLAGNKIGKAFFYLEFYVRAFLYMLSVNPDVINCHSLMTLPLAVAVGKIRKGKVIYDAHELETERIGLGGRAQQISKWVEKNLIRHCKAVIVVSDSINQWYRNTYSITNIFTMRNVPAATARIESTILRDTFKIPSTAQIFLYQGLLSEGRSIELYLNTFKQLPAHQHLVIMGYGPLEQLVADISGKFSNIHFHTAVKPSELLRYTCSADVGLSLIENHCLSYYYSLPNKFFEYMMAELPFIASDFPDMGTIIRRYDAGWAVPVDEASLLKTIKNVTADAIAEKKINIRRMKADFSWENEEQALVKAFHLIEQ